MANPRKQRALVCLEVLRTERVGPHMIRVVLGGPGFDHYTNNEFTDRYVKLVLPRAGSTYPDPFDPEAIRSTRPEDEWPVLRTYTVRSYDAEARELVIDFVHHGDEGVAGPWAAAAEPGDRLYLRGPGGAYAPRPDVDWHLLVGDESAMPAIAAALEAIAPTVPSYLILEVANAKDIGYIELPPLAVVRWLFREPGGTGLLDAVRELEFPVGTMQGFVHGELRAVRALRSHLIDERRIPLDALSISGYWREGKDEDGFQAEKAAESQRAAAAGNGAG